MPRMLSPSGHGSEPAASVAPMHRLLASARRQLRTTLPRLHTRLYRWTGGRLGARFGSLEQVLLTTTGRHSGLPRTTPLAAVSDGNHLLLVASNWGQEHHPAWFHNLLANPEVLVQRGSRTVPMQARVATDHERARLWLLAVRAYHGFDTYAARTSRRIPVVICRPAETPHDASR